MRLINTKTLKLHEFIGRPPPYAILSHTWGGSEVTLQEYQSRSRHHLHHHHHHHREADSNNGFAKILDACRRARSQGLEYAWVDTCCIDKTSSAELGEAINSMFKWYQDAAVCYAFLEDVSARHRDCSEKAACKATEGVMQPTTAGVGLTNSRWFTRGWTLQELIAPRNVEFYDREWNMIGEKQSMVSELRTITGIDTFVIQGGPLEQVSIARRMSWAAHRETSRVEDLAYSLLGIFGVNMPLVYGEGPKAFLRLQEEILRQSDDQTLFAWRADPSDDNKAQVRGLFASSPREFGNFFDGLLERRDSEGVVSRTKDHLVRLWDVESSSEPMSLKNRGIRITGQIQDVRARYERHDTVILLLNCCFGGNPGRTAGIYLRRQDKDRYARIRPDELASVEPTGGHITPLTLYGVRSTAEVRGHHYDQPWTSSYKIRRELAALEDPTFQDIQATKSRYEHAFYIESDSLKPWTLFGRFRLHGVLMADSRGLLRFFRFKPDAAYEDMMIKTYPGFHVVLLYRTRGSSDVILVVLGRKLGGVGVVNGDQQQHWVTATYLTRRELSDNSSRLLDAVGALTETTTASSEVSCDVMDYEFRLWLRLTPSMVEDVPVSQLQIAGPWPTSLGRSFARLGRAGVVKFVSWVAMITWFLTLSFVEGVDPEVVEWPGMMPE
ncbi:hypothetical protein ACJ41O_008703 [Fusarium nematophilum]